MLYFDCSLAVGVGNKLFNISFCFSFHIDFFLGDCFKFIRLIYNLFCILIFCTGNSISFPLFCLILLYNLLYN
jgi:hypothetical protein